jgi:glucan phosphoethanolaminetransferase (alkaline phosphatase superfamily)
MKRPALGNFMQIFVPAVIIVVLVGHLALIAFEIKPVGVVPPSVTRLIMAIFLVAADIIYTVEFMRYANTAKKIFSLSKDETTWTKLEIIAYFGMLSVGWAFLAAVVVFLNSYLTSTLARDLTHVAYTLMLLMLSLSLLFLKFQMKKYGHEDEFATINRRKQSYASSKTRNTDMFYNKSRATSESATEEPTIV